MNQPILEVENLTIQYGTRKGSLTAVSDVSFTIDSGEFFGVVGESGCGKSTVAKSIIGGLDNNGQIKSGTIKYQGEEIQDFTDKKLSNKIRWKEIAWIPQSAMNSLDPLQRMRDQAVEIAQTHTNYSQSEAVHKLRELFDIVGLDPDRVSDYPHEFSGGMQQRVVIALSLLLEPKIIIADEPTTALDVIMQDQIFAHIEEVQESGSISVMLITHDISVVLESCDSMTIMHGGQVVETGTVANLYDSPRHPYSILLQEAFPDIRHPDQELSVIEGVPPELYGEVNYCTFADRCPWAIEECREGAPPLEEVDEKTENGHSVACIRHDEARDLYEKEGTYE